MHRSGEMDICAGKRGARCARMVIAINKKDITSAVSQKLSG